MVPVAVSENVPAVDEVKTPDAWKVPVPEASSNRPVPPVIVHEPLIWKVSAEVGHKTSFDDVNTLSPFAAVKVSCSVAVDPRSHVAGPVMVLEAAKEVSPKCSRTPEPVMVALVPDDVKVKEPEKLPLKGVEWVANTAGKAAESIKARIGGRRSKLFISLLKTPLQPHPFRGTTRVFFAFLKQKILFTFAG